MGYGKKRMILLVVLDLYILLFIHADPLYI